MANIQIKDSTGKAAGDMTLSDTVFGVEPNIAVMHEVVKAQQASWRQGTANSKTRGMVSGGGKKPFRQKGSGRARQGTTRAPQFRGGGAVFGPHTRSYAYRVNKKVTKLAMRSALSAKLADGELVVVDAFNFAEPSTKTAKAFLDTLDVKGRITVVAGADDFNTFLSFRNIEKVTVIPCTWINTYDLLDNAALVMTQDAIQYAEEVLA